MDEIMSVAVLIDTETAVSREFLEAIGVDVSKLLYVSADSVEQIFDFTETIIEKVRETSKDKLVTIVVDSVAAAVVPRFQQLSYTVNILFLKFIQKWQVMKLQVIHTKI